MTPLSGVTCGFADRALLSVLPVLLFAGCASVTPFRGIAIEEDSLYVAGIPPIHQNKNYSCGAACLAAVAAYWNVSPRDFRAKCPHLSEDASGQDLQQLALGLNLDAFVYQGSMADLRDNLRNGRPLIVMIPQPVMPMGDLVTVALIDAWNKWGHRPAHWVVVVGLTKSQDVIIHDPESGGAVISAHSFEKGWAKKSNLALLVFAARQGAN